MSNGSGRSPFGIWTKPSPNPSTSLSHSDAWTDAPAALSSANLESPAGSATIADVFDDVLNPSPQNGRRGNSPDIARSNSPMHYRHRQVNAAQAAQAAALNHSPKDVFLDPRTTAQFSFPDDTRSVSRIKSVMSNTREADQFTNGSGPARASSTPPYANQMLHQGTPSFAPNSNAQFFTPQISQRGYFEPIRDSDVSAAMRNLGLGDSLAPSRYDPPPVRSTSPYAHHAVQGQGPFPYQQQHNDYQQQYPEYGYGARHLEEDYGRMPAHGYESYAYDYRSTGRGSGSVGGNGFRAIDEYGQGVYPGRVRGPPERRGPGNGPDAYHRSSSMTYSPGLHYYEGRGGLSPYNSLPRRQDSGAGLRSPVLEDYRNNKSKKYELRDIFGHIVEFSGDQHGSRFIQQKLETAISDDKEAVFQEILPNSLQLMTDVFGNYVIQKFFEHGNQVQKTVLAKQMEGHVLSLSLQMYGCRVVQKALEHVLAEQQVAMVKELEDSVLKCVKDQNGNHVIQKALERVPSENVQFILSAFHGQAYDLATHPYGCRVVQRMLEYCPEAQAALLEELHHYTLNLIVNQYGNYVSQHIIEHGKPEDRSKVIQVVKGSVMGLSTHKFASNVVEKCILFGTPEERQALIQEVLVPAPGTSSGTGTVTEGQPGIVALIKDQYGNYVLQKMFEAGDRAQRNELMQKIRPQLEHLRKYSHGKHLVSFERLMHEHDAEAQ